MVTIPLKEAYPELQAMLDAKDRKIAKLEAKLAKIKGYLMLRGRSDTKTGIMLILDRD